MSTSVSQSAAVPAHGGAPQGDFSCSSEWLSGGVAVVNEVEQKVQLSDPLRQWLGLGAGSQPSEAEFWSALCGTDLSWEATIRDARAKLVFTVRLELSRAHGTSISWFELELVRSSQVLFIRFNSILPPLPQLEEGGAEEYAQSPGAVLAMRLLRAEGQLRNLMQRWPGVIFSQRPDLTFHSISPKIEDLTGVRVEEFKRSPQRFWEVIHEGDTAEFRQHLRQATESTAAVSSIFRVRNAKKGRVSYVLEHRESVRTRGGLLLGYEGVWLDVTRQTIAEKRLSTAAWKETLSVLTMGLAHDFSNIMAGIHSLSETFQEQVGPDHPFSEGLALIKANSLQATQLIHRILQLHHGKLGERTYRDLTELTREVLELVRKIVPRYIGVEADIPTTAWPVYVDAVEFRQVLINLALNAVDAMPQGGQLHFRVARHESYPALGHVEGTLPRLPSLCVSVEDQGTGIAREHLASIFDPFFTTKSQDKGSGLGLYNARLFAEKHRGAISVASTLKKGTTFSLWLPEADFTEGERVEEATPSKRHTLLLYGPAGSALNSIAELFRKSGCSVVMASPPSTDVAVLNGQGYTVSGVLLLPNGADSSYREMASTIRKANSGLPLMVQPLGCNQDEVEASLIVEADLVVPSDLPSSELLSRVQAMLESIK